MISLEDATILNPCTPQMDLMYDPVVLQIEFVGQRIKAFEKAEMTSD